MKTYDNIIILGDSHVYDLKVLEKENPNDDIFRIIKTVSVSGKTAQGLSKPNNKDIYINKISNLKNKTNRVGIFLGETDCGYALWSRTKRYNTKIKDEVNFATDQLIIFANKLEEIGFRNIFFMEPIIPLVKDYKAKDIPEIIRLRRDVPYTFRQRTKLILDFNKSLRAKAKKHKVISINHQLIDPETGLAKEIYQSDRFFHHLRRKYAISFWTEEFIKLVKEPQ